MEILKEPASLRSGRLFKALLNRSGPMQRYTNMKMSHDALLDAFILLYEECSKESFRTDPRVNNFLKKYRTFISDIKSLRVNLDDFEIQHVIGRGYFGEVTVIKEKLTNDLYAMKTIKKSDTAYNTCTVLFEEEHDIMCTATSHWLTKLQYSFQDKNNLYFIMEYNAGGDLHSLLNNNNGRLSPETARFYLAETALAIRALHLMGYVHRDIKPENILLDSCGHVKLGDFGCAAKLSSSGTVSQPMPMGTPHYIAPEILCSLEFCGGDKSKKQDYGTECDYWSLGILAYELVVGRTPFLCTQLKSVYQNVMRQRKKLKYPESSVIPDSLRDLISNLLQDKDCRYQHDDILRHGFFRKINWPNIRNEAPPFVPNPKTADHISNVTPEHPRKIFLHGEMKDNYKEFSPKNLPFIGFSYSGSFDNEKDPNNDNNDTDSSKNPVLEVLLSIARRENKNLLSKLFEAQFGKSGELECLEKKLEEKKDLLELCEVEKNGFQKELSKFRTEHANLCKMLEYERQNRREVEDNALRLIAETKTRVQREFFEQKQELNSKIEEMNDRLTEAHTINNELASKNDRIKAELMAANNEIEILKKLETDFKNKLNEAREFKRRSVVGLESRLEKMANENQTQANLLQQKLVEEAASKTELEEKLKQMEMTWLAKESQYKQERKDYEDKVRELESKINGQNLDIALLQVQLKEKPNVAALEEQLELEKDTCSKLQAKILTMEQELTNTTHSFMDHESTIAAHEEAMQVLEKELREASEEKILLQKKLQKTKETEEENIQKLSNLEVVVDRLEQGVLKLEAENAKLKQRVVEHVQPQISSEAETRYQEKISILEDQIAKLENQLQKLRETNVLDKELLKTTQTALWKAEKDLSDAKIDIRIVKREAKTSEDLANKLQEEMKKLNEKLEEAEQEKQKYILSEREKSENLSAEKANLKSKLNQKELEIKMLKTQLEELEKSKESEKKLREDYNNLCQEYRIIEKQAEVLKEEKENAREQCQALEMEKVKMQATAEELRHKICSLELNNQVLKETGTMLDEQLEDYDRFTTAQSQKIEALSDEKCKLEKEIENLRVDLRACRQNLNEEKSWKTRAQQREQFLEIEIANRDEQLTKIFNDLANCNSLLEQTRVQLKESEETVALLEVELNLGKQRYASVKDELQWLKRETSTHLSSLYSLRETNYTLTQNLEESNQMIEALQQRVDELQEVVADLEAFHKQREVKDEATKHQQNKLISFLQEKLEETRKKKTLTNVLFGGRSKEHVPLMSPTLKVDSLKRTRDSSKDLFDSPHTKEALLELVKSPSSQTYFQGQSSMQRMYHNIPHRFKNQPVIRDGMCGSCQSPINRGTLGSSCAHCGIQAHPKCALTVPKTCGLPQGLARHYAESVAKMDDENTENFNDKPQVIEGWIKVLNSDKSSWEKRYARVEERNINIFETQPVDNHTSPILTLSMRPGEVNVHVGDGIDPSEVPKTSGVNMPYIIKIVKVPVTSHRTQENHYIMLLNSSDKSKWLSAFHDVIVTSQKYQGSLIHTLPNETPLDLYCVAQITDEIILLGAEEGLFSLRLNQKSSPVRISGPTKVRQLTLVPEIGVAVLIANQTRRLLICDYRALVSNAKAASCTNPNILAKDVNSRLVDGNCVMFAVSPKINDSLYLTAATSTKICLMKWSMSNSEFVEAKSLDTFYPCNCVLYTNKSVILGCDRLFEIKFKNYYIQEFLRTSVSSLAFWKIGSFPIEIFEITKNEYLLCFNEFGVFVNEEGKKTQCDLKWSKVPYGFAYEKPYLYVVHMSSVEVIRVAPFDPKSANDSICTTSTSTVSDSAHLNMNNPRYLGYAKVPGGIFIRVNTADGIGIIHLEGSKVYKDDLGSCVSLNSGSEDSRNKPDGDEFSFTSSLIHSLEEPGTSTPKNDDEDSCSTYTISDAGNTEKKVTFVEKAAY